ncbi:MAG: NAD(P)-dependent dehydrogenase (short-subunit alcohol dehydrogenase family) [Gammaproteobacteria bacterium]|jgi:NAD(P)-dependent dehydrogenase (short-subunit alcohol dehydrogenase family)
MKDSIFSVSGKVALVTGASSGLGAHFAKILANYGAKVVLAARRVGKTEQIVDAIRSEGGVACSVELDVTSQQSVERAFDFAQEQFGLVTIVSNNAGMADAKMAVSITESGWQKTIDTNLNGVWRVAAEAGKRMMAAAEGGSIVNTASILGLRTALAQSSYATSKAAVIQLTNSLSLEWARKNIRVNALCPGYFITEMNQDYFATEKGQNYIATTPAQRTGQLDELTAPFMLLASSAGSFVNGVALAVDGGHQHGNV